MIATSSRHPPRRAIAPGLERLLAVARKIVELHQLLNDLILTPLADALGDAAMQMIFEDQRFQLLDGLAHGVRLPENVYTILVFLDHLANTAEMALDITDSLEDVFFVGPHRTFSSYPYP